MCGIAGSIGHFDDGTVAAVEAMNEAQAHRGPDDQGLFTERATDGGDARGGVVLGHRRLSIIDLSPGGHQPMQHAESGCVICYNGEVYNFAELRSELEAAGARFTSSSDTEVVLEAYVRWGESFLARLRGMFAIALWDPRSQRLLLARDRMGIKPLYMAAIGDGHERDGRVVLFSSELRALLATGRIQRRIDPTSLASYLHNGVVPGPGTLIRGVTLLPAGTCVSIGLDGRAGVPQPYWSLPRAEPIAEDAAVEALDEALRSAVELRLVSDVPLGVFLSGGVDSSALAALATRASDTPVSTFNISFDEARYDESPHAEAVAKALGTDHRTVKLTEADFSARLPDALGSLDQPTFDAINSYFVSRAVREAGLTVALAGTGGDELFGGYSSFVDLPRAAQASKLARPVPELPLRAAAAVVTRLRMGKSGAVKPQTRWGKLGDALATRGDMLGLYQASYGLFTETFRAELQRGGGAALDAGLSADRAFELKRAIEGQPDLHAISMLELTFFLGERLLRDTDAASMAVSLEVRVPLIDHVVVEALARVPGPRRFAPLGKKQLLRERGTPGLDPRIFDRPKAGFELPLDVWCRRTLQAELDDTLLDPVACASAGLHAPAVANLWSAFKNGAPGLYWSRIWALYVLLWWCREHDVSL